MPNKVDATDWLYRMVRPAFCTDGDLSPDAFDDKYAAQSFNLVSVSSPQAMLSKFAGFSGTRKSCNKQPGDPDPDLLEMYDAGYRIAVIPVRILRENELVIEAEASGDEFNPNTGHVNVVGAKHKAAILASSAHVLSREEMQTGFDPSTVNVEG